MRTRFASLLLVISLPLLAAEGDTLHVGDIIYVPVRGTPCNTCTILHRGLVSGTAVIDLGQVQDDWTRIRTPGGIEGWLPNQFLQAEPVARQRLPELEQDMAALQAENGQLQSQLDRLLADLNSMGMVVERVSLEAEDGTAGQTLLQISGDMVGMSTQNQELLRRNQVLQRELDLLVAENERLADTTWRSWFIYGGLAVFAGAILSAMVTRLKKRRGFSEWA